MIIDLAPPAETRSFRVTTAQIGEMDQWLETVGAQWGLADRVVFRARVCVAELAANVREHGAQRPEDGHIVMTLRNRAPALEIEMTDTGAAFDPVAYAGEPATSEHDGGRGLRLVHSYATAMHYKRERDRNILSFRVAPQA